MKSLDAKLAIPMDMAVEFMTQIAKLEGYQQDDAENWQNSRCRAVRNGSDVPTDNAEG